MGIQMRSEKASLPIAPNKINMPNTANMVIVFYRINLVFFILIFNKIRLSGSNHILRWIVFINRSFEKPFSLVVKRVLTFV